MTTVLYGTPAPIDEEDHAAFLALVERLLANPKASKPKSYVHKGVPLVHYAVRTRNIAALNTLAKAGLHLNKPFREGVINDENPTDETTTPLDEALRTDDPAMVTALFQAGLSPKILLQTPDWNKHPYRTVLRARDEPAPCMADALIDALNTQEERDQVAASMAVALCWHEMPFFALIQHLLDRIVSGQARVEAATSALVNVGHSAARSHHAWIHTIVPMLLDAGAIVDGLPGDQAQAQGLVLSRIVVSMRPSAKRERLVKRLLAQEPKADLHAETDLYMDHQGTPFLFALRNNDTVMVEAFIAAGALDGTGLSRARITVGNVLGWKEYDRKRVMQWLVTEEGKVLREAMATEPAEPYAPHGRARL